MLGAKKSKLLRATEETLLMNFCASFVVCVLGCFFDLKLKSFAG
jgi:ABC-type methionine transport system permease subunit